MEYLTQSANTETRLPSELLKLIGIKPNTWMMSPSERLTILGLLLALRPQSTLEFGCAEAGLTSWLSKYSEAVITVDMDAAVLTVTKAFANVTPLHMNTLVAAHLLREQGFHANLTVLDADHSKEGVYRDLKNVLSFSDVIVLHDTYYPPCRDGILSALANHDVYADLEFVPGGLQSDGMWGGLGIVVPSLSRKQQLYTTQRQSIYGAMILPWLLHQSRAALDRRRRRTLERIGRVMAHLLQ